MSSSPIYLDYAATTPVDPRVATVMAECLTSVDLQGNPASATHGFGLAAHDIVENARAEIARLIGATAREIIFTSGATEANNLALLGAAHAARRAGDRGHFVSSRAEHKSVLDCLKRLERDGFAVTLLEPDEWGRVPVDAVRTALRADTLLVSVMDSNNEIGCLNDLDTIASLCRERGVLTHTDASQSCGKRPISVERTHVDLLSLTAHKLYGPKGIGALYVRESARPKVAPIVFGGGHERGLRSGTLATHQAAGFGVAARLARQELYADAPRLGALKAHLMAGLSNLPGAHLNTLAGSASLPGIVNASFEGVEGESLVTGLTELAVSTGSACSSAAREPSYVLRALGRDAELAQSSLRLSFGRFTSAADIDDAVTAIRREVSRLRVIAGRTAIPEAQTALPASDHASMGTLLTHALNPLARRYFRAAPRPAQFPEGVTAPPGYHYGRAGSEAEGAAVRFELKIDGGTVKSARFSAYGCPHTLAVTAWLCEMLEGSRINPGMAGKPADWAEKFAVPPEKLGRLLVVEDALRAAFNP
jgi:cysteine desulfurase